ncbi:UNVERIFIED_CONTAM: hypothetical protein Scaly_2975700 [Sesamum calycinum]|uniref:Uncharacterized protein n=1 Tax=Sesamum calycinum TaxID=2727403 RepID=A0AAW2KPX1_9LAMI
MVEHSLAKAEVEGSSPSFRSWLRRLVGKSRASPCSRKVFVLGTGSNLKGGGIVYSDLPGDSSLARAFESKHGHLLLRGSSRSSIEEPGRVNSKVPYSGCKAEEEGEWAQPHQQPAFPTRKELKMKEESVCTIYGVGVTILNLLFPISPFFAFGSAGNAWPKIGFV